MAAKKKAFVTSFQLFVTLDKAGNLVKQSPTEIDPQEANTKETGARSFRFTFGGFEGAEQGFSVCRNYAWLKGGEVQAGYTTKLGMLPLGQAQKVAQVSERVLAQIVAQSAAA